MGQILRFGVFGDDFAVADDFDMRAGRGEGLQRDAMPQADVFAHDRGGALSLCRKPESARAAGNVVADEGAPLAERLVQQGFVVLRVTRRAVTGSECAC